jgi:HTH-type transcriptional regulator/antitoxin MqsA
METLESCPICGGELLRETRPESFKYKGKMVTVNMEGEYCQTCGEGFQNQADQKINDRNITLAKRHVDNLLEPTDILRIRRKLSLSQKEAAEIFGGGVRAFYKYEHIENNQPKSLDILFRLLDSGKLSLEDIEAVIKQSA